MNAEEKEKTCFNITRSVLKEFNKISKEKAINKSGLVEILISEWIKQQKK